MSHETEKDREIMEYGVRGNVFFGTLAAVEMKELWNTYPHLEIMAAVIALAEQFESERPEGSGEEMMDYTKAHIKEKLNI